MWLLLLPAFLIWLFYKWYVSVYSFWTECGFPSCKSRFPFGSSSVMITRRKYQGHMIDEMYYKMAPEPIFGMFTLRTPFLVARDPEFIQTVLTKEFSHFRGRFFIKNSDEDVLSHHLFSLDGDRWRTLRVKLAPTFTSGKLKAMFPLFIDCSQAFTNLLLKKADSEVDIKELMSRLTTDIISSCAFGLDTNTINDPDNKLRTIGKNLIKLDLLSLLKVALIQIEPKLQKYFPLRFTPIDVEKYVVNLIKETVEYREKNNVKRNDFLDLLIELKNKGTLNEPTKEEIEETCQPVEFTHELMAAQCFIFFFAGFETSSTVQSFCMYELALNQEIQSRLRKEIDEMIRKYGSLTYQAVKDMVYLDMVVLETMRKYPTLPYITRNCTKTFMTAEGQKIEPGVSILIPIWSLHHDPDYFPNPENFDPERFSLEKKNSIKPFTYLPFGEGPRICIGTRFGLLQTKVGIITVLRKFKVEPCAATKIPLELDSKPVVTAPKDPIMLKLVPLEV